MKQSGARQLSRGPVVLLVAACLAGCMSTPQATRERDAEAKEFVMHPATAAVYVYRSGVGQHEDDSVLYADRRLIGATLPGGFFRFDLSPGRHVLSGLAHDQGKLEIDVRPGEIYFVSLEVLGGTSHFALKPADVGRSELLACCVLLENWAPGQRPLLR